MHNFGLQSDPLMTVQLPPAVSEDRSGLPALPNSAIPISSPRRSPASSPPPLSVSPWLEIRLFHVCVSPLAPDSAPPLLTLSHLRRELGTALEINGARVPASEPAAIPLRRDRVDRDAAEITYISTNSVRIIGAVDFEVCDDRGNLILCGSLERVEALWSDGSFGFDHHQLPSSVKDNRTGWSMDCSLAASIASYDFMQPPMCGLSSSPSIEVYVAGCFAGVPLILTQTVQLSPRRRSGWQAALDSILEDEETAGGEQVKNDGLVRRRVSPTPTAAVEEDDEYDPDANISYSYYPEGSYSEQDGQLSWFNAGVRVGIGIGLGMCVGIGIGVGLLVNSYQATTKSFRRRYF